jgi:GAF domain-containing protein
VTAPSEGREGALLEAFVRLADSLVADFDVIDLMHGLTSDCVRLLGADAAGLLLADPDGVLRVTSSSTEQARLVELFQLQADEGPCLDCYRTSKPVNEADLASSGRWPTFTSHALDQGYGAVHAVPLRLRNETVGALNLFNTRAGALPAADLRVAQALADVATIALLQVRTLHDQTVLSQQLQTALSSRVVIEQAKGVLAERGHLEPAEAFTLMRDHARAHQQRLTDLATLVVSGAFDTEGLLPGR